MHENNITSFHGEHSFLSNFYPVKVEYDGVQYVTVEHAYQAAKTLDISYRNKIRLSNRPSIAKAFGKHAPLREGWDEMRIAVMDDLLREKFCRRRYPVLAHMLLATGPRELIEGNRWGDRFWGAELKDGEWVGENHLGKLLMQIRSEL